MTGGWASPSHHVRFSLCCPAGDSGHSELSHKCAPSPCYLVAVHSQVGVSFYKLRREPALLPGEVSLAHHSMLFVNGLPEFSAKVKGVVSSLQAILTTLVPHV